MNNMIKPESFKVDLVYVPSNMLFITAYAAKTCWQSHESLKKHQFDFIASLLNVGHESVIEHGYCIISVDKDSYSAKTVLKFLNMKPAGFNGDKIVASLVEKPKHWFISINMRSLRTAIKFNAVEPNALTQAIINVIVPKLPSCYFKDLLPELSDNRERYENVYHTFSRQDRYAFLSDLRELDLTLLNLIVRDGLITVEEAAQLFKITFRAILPRWGSTQLNRHRGFNISAESLRYVKRTKGEFDYYRSPELIGKEVKVFHKIPNGYSNYPVSFDDIVNILIESATQFEQQGVLAEDCRNLYPLATYTETVYTSSIDDLNHVFDLRLHKHTQRDTRVMMYGIYSFIKNYGFHTLTKLVPETPYELEIQEVLYPITRR